MIKMIAAVSQNGVIGQNGVLPWGNKYPEDMKFFRKMTTRSIVIMGRATFESMQSRPLPKRRNIVISRSKEHFAEVYASVAEAVAVDTTPQCFSLGGDEKKTYFDTSGDIWIIGGANIYREGMKYASEIYLTLIPEEVLGKELVFFPWINPAFKMVELLDLENSTLKVAKYMRS